MKAICPKCNSERIRPLCEDKFNHFCSECLFMFANRHVIFVEESSLPKRQKTKDEIIEELQNRVKELESLVPEYLLS